MFCFLHAADLHLGAPLGISKIPSGWEAFLETLDTQILDNLVGLALAEQVSFVVLAGDVFDTGYPSIRLQKHFTRAMEALAAAGIYCGIIEGNHDLGVWERFAFPLPNRVFVFGTEGETVEWPVRSKDDQGTSSEHGKIAVWGASFDRNRANESVTVKFPEGVSQWWGLGMFHAGQDDQKYHPFSVNELRQSPFCYHALGHEHSFQTKVNPPLVYPGISQARNRGESGTKGVVLVQVEADGSWVAKLCPLASLEWITVFVDITDRDMAAILSACMNALEATTFQAERAAAIVVLRGSNADHRHWMDPFFLEEFKGSLCEEMTFSLPGANERLFVDRLQYQGVPLVSLDELRTQDSFFDQLLKRLSTEEIDSTTLRLARQWEIELDHEEILAEANQWVLSYFAPEEGD